MATLNANINDKDIQTVTVSATPGLNVGLIQRGEKGISIKSIEQTKISTESSGTNEVTVTLDNGTRSTFEVSNGKKGEKGDKGDSGTDGISPVVSINKSGKITTIQITDVNGPHTAIINDGIDGNGAGDMLKSEYDKNNDGIIDNAEKVNGHTVESNVPENAKFTDTLYDDSEIQEKIANQSNEIEKISNKSNEIEKNKANIGTTSDTYDKTKTYAVNDIVIQDGLLYKCKTAVTTAEEFDISKWEKISILDNMLFFVKEGEF